MNGSARTALSKQLSYLLRHNPAAAGLELDENGWVDVALLLGALGPQTERKHLIEVVETSDKQRFQLVDGRIRAAQGHSVTVDLGLTPEEPPPVLWHGTVEKFLDAIRTQGLRPMQRHHVHLSADPETARRVGARRGRPILLQIDAGRLAAAGQLFYRSANGVWLTGAVPPEAITTDHTNR